MKKESFISILTLSIFLGATFIILLNSPIQGNRNSYLSREIASQINMEKEELKKKERRTNELQKEMRKVEKTTNIEKKILSDSEFEEYKKYQIITSRKKISGEGIIITISNADGNKDNIAFVVDSNRILLKVLNVAKQNGAEIIAINNQMISQWSGIVLAGNHLNVNNVLIETPYEIKIIGNEKTLYRFFTKDSAMLKIMQDKYKLSINVEKSRKITIPSIQIYKEIEFIQKDVLE